jgi:hypothetical protein
MTCIALSRGDAYEIYFTDTRVTCILRHPHGLDSSGEEVNYDDLDQQTQTAIFNRLKQALLHHGNNSHAHQSVDDRESEDSP